MPRSLPRFALVFTLLWGCGARTLLSVAEDGGPPDRPPPPDDQPLPFDDGPPEAEVPVLCGRGLTLCDGACVDTRSNVSHCGACGNVCLAGLNCVDGACAPVMFCPMPLATCEPTRCRDLRSDPAHCGRCGNACSANHGAAACAAGSCQTLCDPGFGDCDGAASNGCEADLSATPAHCGVCGRACPAGATCSAGVCQPIAMPGRGLRIDALLTTGCRTAEHAGATGDDRGGIAWAGDRVFYTGDAQTVGFDAETLAPVARVGRRLDGIFGEISVGIPFTLASNRTPLDEATGIVDAVMRVSPEGLVETSSIPLSSTIFLDRRANDVGIFAGPLRALVTQGSRGWLIDATGGLARPRVTPIMVTPIGPHTPCESYAFWGVLEVVDGALWAAYVRDGATIVRQDIVTGAIQTVAAFTAPGGLSDMCSFTVAPSRSRWYFHHEGASQLGRGDETIGYCDARLTSP